MKPMGSAKQAAGGEGGISRPPCGLAPFSAIPAPGPGAGSDLPVERGCEAGTPTGAFGGRARPKRPRRKRRRAYVCPLCGRTLRSHEAYYHVAKHLRELEREGVVQLVRMYGGWVVRARGRVYVGAGWTTLARLAEEVVAGGR